MSNMSYCRFNNTANDLRDCDDHLLCHIEGDDERRARVRLVQSCISILEQMGLSVEDPENPSDSVIDAVAILDALDPSGD